MFDCGFTHDDNRRGEDFECQDCGYQNHADYNAVIGLHPTGTKVVQRLCDGKEHRFSVSPTSAKRRRRRRTCRRALESRDAEREWRVRPSRR
ncbi:transposase [Natrinema halophilum]|nr:transposase [Natrinema halophilum]UHQ95982.1 transposase [Natrinema halophilum]